MRETNENNSVRSLTVRDWVDHSMYIIAVIAIVVCVFRIASCNERIGEGVGPNGSIRK